MNKMLSSLKNEQPLIHNITNYVTVNDVANVLLAAGASPIMADDLAEVEEITSLCKGLTINLGTLNQRTIPSMFLAAKKAMKLNHPIVLDPVGVGASKLRTETALKLIEEVQFTVIRGNISEIKTLASGSGITKGVDANPLDAITEENLKEKIEFAKAFAKKKQCIIVITGAIDLVADDTLCFVIRNGLPQMEKITGTGCQLSALIAAFISANPNHQLKATAAAVAMMGLCGEIAYAHLKNQEGNATYRNRIIDAINQITGEQLEEGAEYEIR